MTLLAYKLHYKLPTSILQINATKMYSECLNANKPFYEWPFWIKKTLHKLWEQKKQAKLLKL